jgi:hypothetical protein
VAVCSMVSSGVLIAVVLLVVGFGIAGTFGSAGGAL